MLIRVIFTLCMALLSACSSYEKPETLHLDLYCSRKMGEDFRDFSLKLKVSPVVNSDGSYPTQGTVQSLWRKNPIAGKFVDKAGGYVFFLDSGWLIRLKSQNAGAYFRQLDVWTGNHYLVRSRFNQRPMQFLGLKCKKLAGYQPSQL